MDYANSKAKENAFYERHGKTPPEVNLHLTEEERERYRKQALEGHVCEWYQDGKLIICRAGENEHGRVIDIMKQRLVGTKDGQPIFAEYEITVVE